MISRQLLHTSGITTIPKDAPHHCNPHVIHLATLPILLAFHFKDQNQPKPIPNDLPASYQNISNSDKYAARNVSAAEII